jgi:hypothetical protein
MENPNLQRLAFKHFVAEGDPSVDQIIGLKNNNTSRILYLYLSSLNEVISTCPKLFEKIKEFDSEGPDAELFEKEIKRYGNKKIMAFVKRYKNKVAAFIQIMYDEKKDGDYKYSPYLVQMSLEDDLEKLREFGQKIKREHENMRTTLYHGEELEDSVDQ